MEEVCAVLFSGGYDSTLTAALAAERFKKVHLVTYRRFGIFKIGRVFTMTEKLKKRYPDIQFENNLIKVDKFYKQICYENYLSNVIKSGFKILSLCGLCKLAMHWRTIMLCLENKINNVYDGAIEESKVFPAQNKDIMLDKLTRVYSKYEINYSNPVYNNEKKYTKTELHKRHLINLNEIEEGQKTTPPPSQPICIDNLLFSRFVDYYSGTHSWERYVDDLSIFYAKKLDYVDKEVEKWRQSR